MAVPNPSAKHTFRLADRLTAARRGRIVLLAGVICIPRDERPLLGATRALIEWAVRRRVAALPNAHFITSTEVIGLTGTPDQRRVTGVKVQARTKPGSTEFSAADLVVDTSGRHSQAPEWLTALGYGLPPEESINAAVGYSSRL